MDIHEMVDVAKREGFLSFVKRAQKEVDKEKLPNIITAVRLALEKKAGFLKIDVDTGDHKKLMVHCPLFGKNVHIEEVCYGCRYNPGTGRFEAKDGEYFQCNYVPGSPTDIWPATRTIQGPKPLKAEKEKIKKKSQTALQEAEKIEREMEKEKYELPSEEDLSYFNNMSKEELEKQLLIYTELSKVLVDNKFGDDMITRSEALHIVDYIKSLLGQTPEELENSPTGTIIEEVPPEEVEALREKMNEDYDEEEIASVASYLWRKNIPPSLVDKEEAEKIASRLGFIKMEKFVKSAPAVLERCINHVMNENKGKKGFTKSNAIAICVNALRDKYPSVEKWVHKKKSEVEKMKKEESFLGMDLENLYKYRDKLNEAEFVVRSNMNIHDEKSMVEGTKLIKKIALERERVNKLIDVQLNPAIFEDKPLEEIIDYEVDHEKISKIDHSLAGEYLQTKKAQEEFDWDAYLDVAPKLLVEQNEILHNWPALMAEAARQEILPKISALSPDKQQEIFIKFMERVEQERKKFAGEKTAEGELYEGEGTVEEYVASKNLGDVGLKINGKQYDISEKKLDSLLKENNMKISDLPGKKVKFEYKTTSLDKDNYIMRISLASEEILDKTEKTSKKRRCRHLNPDKTFVGGFDGCVAHMMECRGLKKENAERLCAYIGRRAGKIPGKASEDESIKKEAQNEPLVGKIVDIQPQGSITLVAIDTGEEGEVPIYKAETRLFLNAIEDAFGSVEEAIGEEIEFEVTDYGIISWFDPVEASSEKMEKESKKELCRHLNPDKTFKGGFDGCVEHMMECRGLKKENAERLCAYIGRRAGKIPGKASENDKMEKIALSPPEKIAEFSIYRYAYKFPEDETYDEEKMDEIINNTFDDFNYDDWMIERFFDEVKKMVADMWDSEKGLSIRSDAEFMRRE